MIPMTLAEIADAVHGTVDGDPTVVVAGPAYIDSRDPVPDGLYVAIVGERVDGHDFASGAHAVLASRPTGAPSVLVDDPVVALGRLARHVVDRLDVTVLALTGSQGKTGTKDYLAQVLAGVGATVATVGNHNNEIGVPLTVLCADGETDYLVVEMGARGVGHIAYLCEIAPPQVAAVLNVGTAHLGEFGSREAIAQAKGEIVEALPADGTAVLNAHDQLVAPMAKRTSARVLTFGDGADVSARHVAVDDLARPGFELGANGRWRSVELQQSGMHQLDNALAAAAMALAVDVPLEVVAERLTSATSSSAMRMELRERADGLLVINDAYNANPASMAAAIEALTRIGQRSGGVRRRTVAVLGEMRELGESAHDAHVEIGKVAARAGVDVVVVVGEPAAGIAQGFGDEAIVTAGRPDALAWVRENVAAGDVVLVKASRGAALEEIADELLDAHPDAQPEEQVDVHVEGEGSAP